MTQSKFLDFTAVRYFDNNDIDFFKYIASALFAYLHRCCRLLKSTFDAQFASTSAICSSKSLGRVESFR